MKSDALPKVLAAEKGGVFLLHGEEEHGKEEAARALIEAHLDPATRDFNLDLLRGSDVNVETLASTLGTPPMMAEWRVVLLRETEALAGSPRARQALLDVVGAPPPGLALILICTVPSGSSARFYSDLEKGARAFEFRSPSPNDLPGWLMERAREQFDRELDESAARALAQSVGGNVPILIQELEKLSTLVGEGGVITRETVEAAGTRLPRQDRWEWFDLVGNRRFAEALAGLPVLLDHGESGVGLTAGLGTHFLRIGVALTGGGKGLEAALPHRQKWLKKRFLDQARGWTVEEVEGALKDLLQVDRLLKSSPMDEEHFVEGWLLARMAGAREAA
jgi:DNA polymerase III subunit delta